jgi:hypothetical protein
MLIRHRMTIGYLRWNWLCLKVDLIHWLKR